MSGYRPIDRIPEYKRGEKLHADTVNAITRALKAGGAFEFGAGDSDSQAVADKRYDEEQDWIPFNTVSAVALKPHELVVIQDTARFSGDEGYEVSLAQGAAPGGHVNYYLVNGPSFVGSGSGSHGYGSFCFDGGWVAYNEGSGHPLPYQEWYPNGKRLQKNTVSGNDSNHPFLSLGGYRVLQDGSYVGRFVQLPPSMECWYDARYLFPAPYVETAIATHLVFPAATSYWNCEQDADGLIKVWLPGKYLFHATIAMYPAYYENAYPAPPYYDYMSVGFYNVTGADPDAGSGGAGWLGGVSMRFANTGVGANGIIPACVSNQIIVNLQKDNRIMLRNDSGAVMRHIQLAVTLNRIGEFNSNSFNPYA